MISTLLGLAGLIYSLYFVFNHPHAGFSGYLDKPAMVLIGFCPPAIMLLSHSLGDLLMGVKLLFSAMLSRQKFQRNEVITILTQAASLMRTEGVGSLLKLKDKTRYSLLQDGLSLIVHNFTPEEIRHNLTARIESRQTHMNLASNLFQNMSKLCPGVGMIGTLIGLIKMLSQMKDPSVMGSGMAMAMVTTLYGLLLGTAIYGPWGEKIALEAEKVLETDMLVLEGIMNIKSKKSSLHMSDLMKTYGTAQPSKSAS
jgi:chemotaxis protein MotA